MTQQEPATPAAPKQIPWGIRLAHWGRIAISLLTVGFVYPHAISEGMDLTKMQAETEGNLYTKKKD